MSVMQTHLIYNDDSESINVEGPLLVKGASV